jgi:hypothetical protein
VPASSQQGTSEIAATNWSGAVVMPSCAWPLEVGDADVGQDGGERVVT